MLYLFNSYGVCKISVVVGFPSAMQLYSAKHLLGDANIERYITFNQNITALKIYGLFILLEKPLHTYPLYNELTYRNRLFN